MAIALLASELSAIAAIPEVVQRDSSAILLTSCFPGRIRYIETKPYMGAGALAYHPRYSTFLAAAMNSLRIEGPHVGNLKVIILTAT